MAKNIVIFSDGTGQKGGIGSNTNVYKLFNMIEDRTQRQIAFYDPGLGTNWRVITGKLFGSGFSKNIMDCYRFLFENYEAGDKVYLFGFSRGAATVRSLSSFIHLFGILPKSRPELIKQAYAIYIKKNPEEKAARFINKHHTMWCKIEFLGVWDTVAALGLPIKTLGFFLDKFIPHKFHSYKLSDSVNYARHALSIDDERKTFHPLIWEKLNGNNSKDRMKQVWFAGVHTDVGGGYPEDELSNISLKWMIKEAVEKKLIIYEYSTRYAELIASKSNSNGIMHNEQIKRPGKWLKREVRKWDVSVHGEPCIYQSVLDRTKNSNNEDTPKYKPWIFELWNNTKNISN
ncbi:MAG: DUF2235 domain-containing protein [Bacteroidetes bacterium]|nr:DUF2235 domain-containing protein [Bacteroidota bacterium]